MQLISALLLLASAKYGSANRLRGSAKSRQLNSYYYSTTDTNVLGHANVDAAAENPLKGLLTSPRWTGGNTPNNVPSSLEFYYFGLDEIMRGSNDFDWTVLDTSIADAESRNNHVIWRVFCHYPGQPLRIPQYLIDAGLPLVTTATDGVSPQYDSPILLDALQQFITAFGARYDGHKSVGFIQLGLLGKWGEWHTYPETNLLSVETKDKVVGWFQAAFQTTQMQVRNALPSAYAAGMGLHDDSFAYSTLGDTDWFFWPEVEKAGQTSFWMKGAMGGETRPELQASIFKKDYVADGSDMYKQDFGECVETTHTTYMFHHSLFEGTTMDDVERENARRAAASMGYNFAVTAVGVTDSADGFVAVDVTVSQTGVAPFYYPLSIQLSCAGTTETLHGVEALVEKGSSKVISFQDIPADSACLEKVGLSLQSSHAHAGRPIKFAQGADGTVSLKLPLPQGATVLAAATTTTTAPVAAPTLAPVSPASIAPTTSVPLSPAPTTLAPATVAPTSTPVAAPVAASTSAPATSAPISVAPVSSAPFSTFAPVTSAPVATPTAGPTAADIVLAPVPTKVAATTTQPAKKAATTVPTPVATPTAAPVAATLATASPAASTTVAQAAAASASTAPTNAPQRQPKLFTELLWAYAQGKSP